MQLLYKWSVPYMCKSISMIMYFNLLSSFILKCINIIRIINFSITQYFSWIPCCAKVFVDNADNWQYLVGPNDTDSTELVQEFFSAVAAVMSGQLRGMVINSLHDFLHFFQTHKVKYSCSYFQSKTGAIIWIEVFSYMPITFKWTCPSTIFGTVHYHS